MNKNPLRSVDPRPVKRKASEEIKNDVEKWLAAGNKIQRLPSYCDSPDSYVFGKIVGARW